MSCDIVAHAAEADDVQRRRVDAISRIVQATLARADVTSFWASGGDGGHVVFASAGWQPAAVDLILRLWEWARREDVPLRLTAHAGELERLTGADGGVQFVGEAINCAGRLLELADPSGVVASDELRQAFLAAGTGGDVVCHHPRWVQLRHFPGRFLFLLSIPPSVESTWGMRFEGDRALLQTAVAARDGWAVIHRAKRLMQVNARDRTAERGVQLLTGSQLQAGTPSAASGEKEPNPFLGPLPGPSRVELVRVAQLIERRANELVCRSGDDGDMMFVLLAGEVGVVMPSERGGQSLELDSPTFTLTAGDTVGELAFALRRARTASLVATTDVALLGFQYEEVESRLYGNPLTRDALTQVGRFMTERVLEHLYEQALDLVPADRADEPGEVEASRRAALDNAAACTSILKVGARAGVSLEELAVRDPVDPGGVYLLAGGVLRGSSAKEKRVEADRYPMLYADVREIFVTPDHEYTVEQDAVIVHIGQAAILALDPAALDTYIDSLGRRARECYYYDAFFSYNFHDAPTVERWERAMGEQGLRVYRDELRVGHRFPERLRGAIADSLTVVAFLSANTLVRSADENWVRREVEFRESLFEGGSAVIIPVILFGGDVEAIASGHSPVDARGNEEEAIRTVIEAIRRIRSGEDPAPFGRSRSPLLDTRASDER